MSDLDMEFSGFSSATALSAALMTILSAVESALRKLHPPLLPAIADALRPFRDRLDAAVRAFPAGDWPDAVKAPLDSAITLARTCLDRLIASGQGAPDDKRPDQMIGDLLGAIRAHCRAQEAVYPLHCRLAPVSRYFLEPALREKWKYYGIKGDPDRTGLWPLSDKSEWEDDHFLYVPESWDGTSKVPLVVALHGGSQTGRDFIWWWLREARGRRFILFAPKSIARTWSFQNGDDADAIFGMVEDLKTRYPIDPNRMLLTGFSDGGIYSLTCGLMRNSPFTVLAPVSAVLHPGYLENAQNKRIYWVHGSLDWMFPVAYARQACHILKTAGAEIVFRELPDLSHTYPREANAGILDWFDPDLSFDRNAGF